MGWDKRGYYYGKRRHGKKVTSTYYGRDPVAQAFAGRTRAGRQEAVACRAEMEKLKQESQMLDAPIVLLDKKVRVAFDASLVAAGYHKHKRSEWRKRRSNKSEAEIMSKKSKIAVQPNPKDHDEQAQVDKAKVDKAKADKAKVDKAKADQCFKDLLEEAHRDPTATTRLMEWLEQNGVLPDFLEMFNLADHAELTLIKTACKDDDVMAQLGMKKQFEVMKHDLAGPAATPLERLLAERIVLCWAHVNFYEKLMFGNFKNLSMPQADHYGKRLDQANRRFLGAVKELAQLRKLQPPMIQVNIGDNQANVMQGEARQANVKRTENYSG